jgi:hypothetical protein
MLISIDLIILNIGNFLKNFMILGAATRPHDWGTIED